MFNESGDTFAHFSNDSKQDFALKYNLMNIPLSLYIHVPWCLKKCPYCDFYSIPYSKVFPEIAYINACLKDLDQDLATINTPQQLNSIFLGGGTPSLLSSNTIRHLLQNIRQRIEFAHNIEITLEANPATADLKKLEAFQSAGINRLSIGVQSFQQKKLKSLERIHTEKEANHFITLAKQAGFSNINLDLMYGLPCQTTQDALADLTTAIHHQPTHISWYALTLEAGTPFGHHPPKQLPPEETLFSIQQQGEKILEQAGYHHYEISAYAKQAHECRHNLNYWRFGDYLGIGAAAHGKVTSPTNQIIRYEHIKNPSKYMQSAPSKEKQYIINPNQLPLEFMMNALRLTKGISLDLFSKRTGLTTASLEQAIQKGIQQDLLCQNGQHLNTTLLGRRFLNDTLLLF